MRRWRSSLVRWQGFVGRMVDPSLTPTRPLDPSERPPKLMVKVRPSPKFAAGTHVFSTCGVGCARALAAPDQPQKRGCRTSATAAVVVLRARQLVAASCAKKSTTGSKLLTCDALARFFADTTSPCPKHSIATARFRQELENNLYCGDLHSGNIILLRDSRIALLDCGSVGFGDREYLEKFCLFMGLWLSSIMIKPQTCCFSCPKDFR
jgi:hypothetical protein